MAHSDTHRPASRISLAPLALAVFGGAVALKLLGSSGHVPPPARDSAPGRTARRTRFGDYAVVGRSVTINRPRRELFAFWRDFENLPKFMENVQSVQFTGKKRAVWTISAPFGQTVEVETEIVEERKDELIAWRSVEGSEVETEGRIHFKDAPAGRGTVIEAIIAYKPPAGETGRLIAKLFQKEPNIQGRRELKRLKMLMETGEIATAQFHTQTA
ncbi:SRPBCC family protein [Roseibium salinum]|uniref:SRPBCC family protein n=1 Tax=Roseibium salinum TaxID=1604349 RepID=A0ABT3QVQ8_9HYPH|nr:SRPBCC family protein [Roseibium sp. DSM 29163]MCX2721007.1 SRPBCC family protein [Roseibium sp. DSM 29163]